MAILQELNVQCSVWHEHVCLCVTLSERVGKKKGVSMTNLHLS